MVSSSTRSAGRLTFPRRQGCALPVAGRRKGGSIMASVTGNALAAQALRAEGAEVIFYLAGGPMFDVMWEAMRLGVRAIHTRHEQGAAMMAHGYARASGK